MMPVLYDWTDREFNMYSISVALCGHYFLQRVHLVALLFESFVLVYTYMGIMHVAI